MHEIPDNKVPVGEERVRDATAHNWVDRYAPARLRPYLRLSRADRPIGTWLLLLPCWWGILLAVIAHGWAWIDLWLVPASVIGAFLMRGAGCTWNDLADREIDASVARTRARPLPSGQVSPTGATAWMIAQSLSAFAILVTFNTPAIICGIVALAPVAVYPFAKRVTWWPQVFLGIAFNWGVLLLWLAHTGRLELAPVALYAAGIAWTLHYDTIYAHQDREDDALIGVRSTARLFRHDTAQWLWIFTLSTGAFAALALALVEAGIAAYLGLAAMLGHMVWQILRLDIEDPDRCLYLFRATRWAGIALVLGLLVDALV